MRKLILISMVILFAVAPAAVLAESRTVTLSVSGMT